MFWGGPRPWVKAPVIPGHEFFGTVVEVGKGAAEAHGVVPGDLAIAEQIYPCDACRYCRPRQYWVCEVHDIYGFQRGVANGAWATHMRDADALVTHRLPLGDFQQGLELVAAGEAIKVMLGPEEGGA